MGVLLVVAAFLVGPSCAPKQEQAAQRATKENPYEFEKEGTIPPLKEGDVRPETDFEEIPVEENDIVGEDFEAPRDTSRAGSAAGAGTAPPPKPGGAPAGVAGKDGAVLTPVFRVQIVALESEMSAQDAQRTAESRLKPLPVYIEWVDGMYKVRVGDCQTRPEAEKVLRRCRESGYPDAWIVTSALRARAGAGEN